jgi:amino acid transporter
MAGARPEAELQRGAVGLTEVLFQSITFMAPAVAAALSIGFATTFAGGITPLAVLFALIACLFTAYSMGQFGRRMTSAGGMYTWVSRGLGPFFGWLVAWIYTLAGPVVPAALYASFGVFGAALITELTGYSNEWLWLALTVVCGLVVWALTYYGIQLSTRVGVILGVIEIGIFLVVSALLVANAATPVNTAVFIPADGNIAPALQGMVFCILAFVGFEGAAPLGEEAREPRRTIPRAVLLACILIGLFYIFCYYAATVFFGPDAMKTDFLGANDGNPWGGMAEQVLPGIGSLLVTFAIVNSSIANANAGANASTRVLFSLGRSRLLPGALSAVHPTHRTPVNAVHLQGIIGLVLAVALSLYFGGETSADGALTTYFFIGLILGLAFAAMYVAVNAAAIGYFLGEGRADFNVVKHLIVPIVGVVVMLIGFVSAIGGLTIPIIDAKIPALSPPFSYTPAIVAVWAVAGVVLYFWLRARDPQATSEIGAAVAEA